MTPEDALLLDALLAEQKRLHSRVDELDAKIAAFRAGVATRTEKDLASERRHDEVPSAPVLSLAAPTSPPLPATTPPGVSTPPEHIPPPLPRAAAAAKESALPVNFALPASQPSPSQPPLQVPGGALPAEPAPKDTWELQLGTVWFARIGIVVLITGLVFLGNYAWQHVVARLGAGGKLAMLVAAGALLAGLGRWLEGRAEATRNYGRVLIAGGAATLYYSAYAAHFVRPLQVIESPLVGGGLLLALAGLFIGWADRQRSQMVAVLTIVLAYYTSAINPIGNFTLFSSLLLTAGAVWLLLRHSWDTLGWASLAGTYGSFAYWRFIHPMQGTHWTIGLAFVLGYWVLFTGGGLLRAAEKMPETRRTAFLTLNNAAFFGLAAWRFLSLEPGYFGWFAIIYGAVLLSLSVLARQRLAEQPAVERAFLVQGLLLVTVGFIAKFTGAQLALLLAVESALLLGATRWRHSLIFQCFSVLTGGAAWMAAWLQGGSLLPGGVGAILVFNAWWLRAQLPQLRERPVDLRAALFVAGGISLFVPALRQVLAPDNLPLAWALMALLGTASIYLLRVPELALGTQVVLTVAIVRLFAYPQQVPWWQALPPLAGAVALSHWWQRQTVLKLQVELIRCLQLAWAVGAAIVGIAMLNDHAQGNTWLVATSGAALAMFLYGLLTRSWAMAVAGQIFTVLAVASFLERVASDSPSGLAALAPVALLAVTAFILRHSERWLFAGEAARQLTLVSRAYRLGAYVLFAIWLWEFAPAKWLPLAYVATGAVVLFANRFLAPDSARIGSAFLLAGLLVYAGLSWGSSSWGDLLAIVLAPLALRVSNRFGPAGGAAPPEWLRRSVLILAVASLWLWATRWTLTHEGSRGLTVAWSVLALVVFGTGLGLQERIYRLAGFLFLGLAVGRVFLVDVWRLETLNRILSFLVLGIVLLVLGFIYNRYADRIRRLL